MSRYGWRGASGEDGMAAVALDGVRRMVERAARDGKDYGIAWREDPPLQFIYYRGGGISVNGVLVNEYQAALATRSCETPLEGC